MSIDIAILGGWIGTIFAVILLQIWEVARPAHDHLGFVALIGSAFSPKPLAQQLIGRAVLFVVGSFYGIFTSAVIYAFEAEAIAWLIGIVVSVLLWILTGITLTYFRLLHPLIRRGQIKAPGAFGMAYSRESAVLLLIAHLIFGLVCGIVYGTIG